MNSVQGDELIIEKISDYIINKYNLKVSIETKKPLRELFPKPENKWLSTIWSHGHADISVYRHGELKCIIEPGGSAHLREARQISADKRKDRLCKLNGVNVLRLMNSVINCLDHPKTKRLFRKYIYS